jgi:hypothetical protein
VCTIDVPGISELPGTSTCDDRVPVLLTSSPFPDQSVRFGSPGPRMPPGQIRQNSKRLRASTASASSAQVNDLSCLMAQDSEVARRRFDAMLGMNFGGWSQEHEWVGEDVLGPRGVGEPRLIFGPIPTVAWGKAILE